VTGIDAAPENIEAARAHAAGQGLAIDYRAGEIGQLAAEGHRYDLVISMEVIEHVADPATFVAQLASLLAPGGLLLVSTPNRTPRSKMMMITLGESIGGIPKGTHDWARFATPEELEAMLSTAGLRVIDRKGLAFSVARGFHLSDDLSLDYFLAAVALET
jgi:2-polyprenyl-6-hydroxyphenyl methylase/3-demethylubiquinone-9 3-methyltransferase